MDKKPIAVLTALWAGTLCMPLAAVAQQAVLTEPQSTQAQADRPIQVGHDVVDSLSDLGDDVEDLLKAMARGGENMGIADWPRAQTQLDQLQLRLAQLQLTLERKTQTTDVGWFEWFTEGNFTVTVREQVEGLASVLEDAAILLASVQAQPTMQGIIGRDVVGQVDDVRQAMRDVVNAMQSASPRFGGFDPGLGRFELVEQRLDTMEQELDRAAERSDEEWGTYVTGQEYRVFVHDSVAELARILRSVFQPDDQP